MDSGVTIAPGYCNRLVARRGVARGARAWGPGSTGRGAPEGANLLEKQMLPKEGTRAGDLINRSGGMRQCRMLPVSTLGRCVWF